MWMLALKYWRVTLALAAAVALFSFLVYERHKFILEGEADAKHQIELANDRDAERAAKAAQTVDACYAAGGDWDRARGVCVSPTGR